MAWNRPIEEKVKAPGEGEQRNVHVKGLVAGVIVVLGAAVAAWWIWPSGESAGETPSPQTRELIKEVKPAVKAVAKPAETNAVKAVDPNARPTKVGEIVNGYVMLLGGRLRKVKGVTKPSAIRKTLAQQTFKHHSDVSLANLLTAEPGGLMVGDSSMYYKNFDKEFAKSLKDPIIIEKDDSEEVRELKKGVIELRAEMQERIKAGEDPVKVMRQARDELMEASIYRRDLEKQVDTIMRDGKNLTEKDLEDLVNGANEMLKGRGAKPIRFDKALKYKLKAYQRKARKENAQ